MERKPLKVGLMSRLDYGGGDYRVGLWQLATDIFRKEQVDYIELLGGLVDFKALDAKLKAILKSVKKDQREDATQAFLRKIAEFLKDNLPVIEGVKIYIITSPAYDGWIGKEVSRILSDMRADILLYREGGDRLELRQLGKILGSYVPKKGAFFRGDYYDTPVLRVLKDELRRSTRGIGDINAVGCFGSAIFHPGASSDVRKPYASVPALCKIGESKTGVDNQVGVMVFDFGTANPKEVTTKVYSFKDLLSDEWLFVESPEGITATQKNLIDVLRKRGPLTVGSLQDTTDLDRKVIADALAELMNQPATNVWPGVVQDKDDQRYYLNLSWFCDKMRYKLPKEEKLDSFAAFGCMHGGCRHSDMLYMHDVLPELAIQNGVDTLVGVGDFIEGLKHDLMILGEISTGSKHVLNYSKQEKLSAFLIGTAMFKVFKHRFEILLKENSKTKIGQKRLAELINRSMMKFVYIAGNHCGWVAPLGFDPLGTFRSELRTFLLYHVARHLEGYDLCVHDLNAILQSKIIQLDQNEPYQVNSGLSIALLHPSMSRTKTTSIRPQEMLGKAEEAKSTIVFGANFHVGEVVHHWNFEYGQRICLQLGTLKVKSGFEETKMKTVDFGVGFMKVWSSGTRVQRTETTFYCTPTSNVDAGNRKVLRAYDRWLETNK
ncbi:MAG: hypothetical protein Q8P76_02835 [bacterium]|nr:hypothetical protein [bacterium]